MKRRMIMRKMFKILLICLCVCLICSSAACGGSGTSSLVSDSSKPTVSEDTSSEKVSFEGQKVILAAWKDPWSSAFDDLWAVYDYLKDEYDLNFELYLIGKSDSVQTVQAAIATNTQPDLFYVGGQFLSAVSVLQPLESTGVDLRKFENQAILNATKIDGKPYIAAGESVRYCPFDICVYNKELFKKAGITTPTEYFERGEWTFENFVFSAEKIAALGKEYLGASLLHTAAFSLSGDSFYRLKNGRAEYSEGEKLLSAYEELQGLCKRGTMKMDRSSFGNGKDGMAITNTFGLMRTGHFAKINPEHLGAVLLPKMSQEDEHTVTAPIAGYGVVKGCKNPKAAAVALEALAAPLEGLHHSENTLDKCFHNKEVKEFYFETYEKYCKNIVYYIEDDVSLKQDTYSALFSDMWSEFGDKSVEKVIADHRENHKKTIEKINQNIEKSLQPPPPPPETDPRVEEFLRQ